MGSASDVKGDDKFYVELFGVKSYEEARYVVTSLSFIPCLPSHVFHVATSNKCGRIFAAVDILRDGGSFLYFSLPSKVHRRSPPSKLLWCRDPRILFGYYATRAKNEWIRIQSTLANTPDFKVLVDVRSYFKAAQ